MSNAVKSRASRSGSPIFELKHEIPIVDPAIHVGSYTAIPIDPRDPRHSEPLVRLESVGVAYESHHARTDGGNWPYHRPVAGARKDMWLRRSAAAILAKVNARLAPFGAELFVLDGYRPIACQRGLWAFYFDRAARVLADPSPEARRAYALKHVFDPGPFDKADPATWPAHSTGAAVDLTLRDIKSAKLLDMGARFEDIDAVSANDHFERERAAGRIAADDPRLWNRRLIHWAMSSEGFRNDPFVFWHYDWGNQLYVKVGKALLSQAPDAAWYGYIAAPDEEW